MDAQLVEAVKRGDLAGAQVALGGGADVECTDGWFGQTPLSYAAEKGHAAVVRLLLSRGAKPNAACKFGSTPLRMDAQSGKTKTQLLLMTRAPVKAAEGKDGWTPLHFAAVGGHLDCARLLLEHAADADVKDKAGKVPLDLVVDDAYDTVDERAAKEAMRALLRDRVPRRMMADSQARPRSSEEGAPPGAGAANGVADSAAAVSAVLALLESQHFRSWEPPEASSNSVADETRSAALDRLEREHLSSWGPDEAEVDDGDARAAFERLQRQRFASAGHEAPPEPNGRGRVVGAVPRSADRRVAGEHADAVTAALRVADAGSGSAAAAQAEGSTASLPETPTDSRSEPQPLLLMDPASYMRGGVPVSYRNSRMRDAARTAARDAAASVPAELAEWLETLKLSEYGPRLVADHKVAFLAECCDLKQAELKASGLAPLEVKRFLEAAKKLCSDATPVAAPAAPPVRIRALCIGINDYNKRVPGRLRYAVADATAVHEALRALPNAASTLVTDCSKARLEAALQDFRDDAGECKGRGLKCAAGQPAERTLALVFFAGHGLQVHGQNYLVPKDFTPPRPHERMDVMLDDTAHACIPLEVLDRKLEQSGVYAGAVLLDCCRSVPDFLAVRGATRAAAATRTLLVGMAQAPRPVMKELTVTFATRPGLEALDESASMPGHSPFTAALLKAFAKLPMQLKDLGPTLKTEVDADTGGEQLPDRVGEYGTDASNLLLG